MRGIRILVAGATLLLVQAAILPFLPVLGVQIDLLVMVALAAGITGGPERGLIVGFAAGLLFDLLVRTPFGMAALINCLVGYTAGTLTMVRVREHWWIDPLSGFCAASVAVIAFAAAGEMVGEPFLSTPGLGLAAVVSGIVAAVLIVPILRVIEWAFQPPEDSGMLL